MRRGFFFSVLLVACSAALAQPTNDQDKNKETARAFFEEVIGENHLERYAESHSKDFVAHGATRDGSLEEDLAAAKEERQALPDMKVRVNLILAERDFGGGVLDCLGHEHSAGNGISRDGQENQR